MVFGKLNWAAKRAFQQCGILTSVDSDEPLQPHIKLRNSKWCSQNIQAISKGTDQTARMRRLIWGFAGRTYHIVRNLMSRLNYLGLLDPRTLLPIAPLHGGKSNRLKMANIADWRFVQISTNCRTRNFIRIRYPNFNLSFTFSKTPSVCQTFWIQIRPNVLLCMIWVETICQAYHW